MKRVTCSGIAAVALAMAVACTGNKNTSPSAPTPVTPTVTVSSITVTNTSSSSSGATFQLNAAARMSDGTMRDVTTSAVWETSNAALATVSPTGVLTVVGSGEVEVRATYQSTMGSLKILVSRPPSATKFALSGVVHEVAPAAKLVANVRVQITSGADTGTFVVTDSSGQFRFTNVSAGVISMDATKDGYELWRVTNLDMDQDRLLDVTLYPNPPTNAAGATATARCNDTTWSWASTRAEACTTAGGVAYGVCPGPMCDGRLQPGAVRSGG
jgi:hypothetical protein